MKRHIDLETLVRELQTEQKQKLDTVVPASCLSMESGNLVLRNCVANPELDKILYETGISTVGAEQRISLQCLSTMDNHLADKLGIPSRYFDKMREGHIELLDKNVSYWFEQSQNKYLLRTFIDKDGGTGVARALLSDRYKTLDNYDILLATLQAISETGLNVVIDEGGCDISDKKLYMRFVCPDVQIDSSELLRRYRPNGERSERGDGIVSGFVITNSEVGAGALSIAARAKVLACSNGLVKVDEKFHQRHLGSRMEEFSSVDWSENTKRKNIELIIAQIKDTIKHFVSEGFLGQYINDLVQKGKPEIQHPADCIKAISNELGFSEERANDILSVFIKSGDPTRFGAVQALTYHAGRQEDPDLQYEIEKQAVEILDRMDEFDKPLARKSTKTQSNLN